MMMSTASKITINTDGISNAQRVTAKFQSAYRNMRAQLGAPGFIPVLCAHEAAHVIFFAIAGMKNYDTKPASLKYDPLIDDYVGSLASIQVLDLPPWTPGAFWEWFGKIACGHAAGGVVARKLMPSSDGGDQDDKERFKTLCDKLNADPNVSIDFEITWKSAQDLVSTLLEEDPKIMAAIQEKALELQPLFGL